MAIPHFRISIIKDNKNCRLLLKSNSRRGFLDLGSKGRITLGPRKEKRWTTLYETLGYHKQDVGKSAGVTWRALVDTAYSRKAANYLTSWKTIPHRRYPCFDVVVGLAWSNDPESYDGGSVATVPCRTGQRWWPRLREIPGPPGLGLGVRLTSHRKNYHCYETQKKPRSEETFKGGQDYYRVVEPMMMMMSWVTVTVSRRSLFHEGQNTVLWPRELIHQCNNCLYLYWEFTEKTVFCIALSTSMFQWIASRHEPPRKLVCLSLWPPYRLRQFVGWPRQTLQTQHGAPIRLRFRRAYVFSSRSYTASSTSESEKLRMARRTQNARINHEYPGCLHLASNTRNPLQQKTIRLLTQTRKPLNPISSDIQRTSLVQEDRRFRGAYWLDYLHL
jgi:hypothetical protein